MAAAAVIQAPFSATHNVQQGVYTGKNALRIRRKLVTFDHSITQTLSSGSGRFVASASKSPNKGTNSNADDAASQDDVNFLLKLVAGSFAGAAAIKYGSILLPEITRPNITQALIMISTPVMVAVLILIKESQVPR